MVIKKSTKRSFIFEDRFWDDPREWPHNPSGYVFLARAFDQMGRAIIGDQWNVLEVPVEEPNEPADSCDEATWDRYEEEEDRYDEAYDQALDERRAKIADTIAKQCELGNLQTALRRKTGKMSPIEAYSWNADDFRDRFRRCEMSVSGERCWIFVKAGGLDQFLMTQPHIKLAGIDAPHLSPYLKVMLFVCTKMKITVEHQPKKIEIETEIEKAWTGQPLSKKLLGSMATLVRERESQSGRATKK